MSLARLRWILVAIGLGVTLVGLLPLALVYVATVTTGGAAFLAVVGAILTSPALVLLFAGPALMMAAFRAKPVVVFGRQWTASRDAAKREAETREADVIDGEFEEAK